jgi:putative chitinase
MQVTAKTLAQVAGGTENENMRSTVAGLQRSGVGAGLERPHRLAMFLGQLSHESQGWRYDRELWGPTAAQKRYDTRTDLGNTAAADGDGFLYRGRGPIQITGKDNYRQFTAWARKMASDAPDFVANPDAVNTDPWEGLGPIWYWDTRNINSMADRGDYETVTRRINGGLNGYKDRQERYARAALTLMGRNPADVKGYQKAVGLVADGVVGPATIASMHKALSTMPPVSFGVTVSDAVRPPAKPNAPSGPTSIIIAAIVAAVGVAFAFLKG